MSHRMLSWAHAQTAGGAHPKALLIALAGYSDETGMVRVSDLYERMLTDLTELSDDEFDAAWNRLVDSGLIVKTGDRLWRMGWL